MDTFASVIIKMIQDGATVEDKTVARQLINFTYDGSYIHYAGTHEARVYVPDVGSLRADIIRSIHDTGHLGKDKTYNGLARSTYWPRMYEDVSQFIRSFRECITAPDVARLFEQHLISKHGVPVTIVSDRDPKFTSNYWQCLTQLTNIRLNISSADHPQRKQLTGT